MKEGILIMKAKKVNLHPFGDHFIYSYCNSGPCTDLHT